jgi:hypothetical protein
MYFYLMHVRFLDCIASIARAKRSTPLPTLSYLYFPPITFNLINMPISSDEVLAKQVLVLPTRQPPRWWVLARNLLVAVGIAALLYGLFLLRQWLQAIYVASP